MASTITLTIYQNGDFWTGTDWKSNTNAQDPAVQLHATVQSGGAWSYTSVPTGAKLRAGSYALSVSGRDVAGNNSASQPGVNQIQFKVDKDTPAVTITLPANGSTINSLCLLYTSDAADE